MLFVFMVTFLPVSALIIAGNNCTPCGVGIKENGFEIVVDVESVLTTLAIISLLSLSLNE